MQGGGAARPSLFVIFSLFSRPRAGLLTVQSSFFGLATNTLNVMDNSNISFLAFVGVARAYIRAGMRRLNYISPLCLSLCISYICLPDHKETWG